jgi:hypothetical protein
MADATTNRTTHEAMSESAYRFLVGAAGAAAFEAMKLWQIHDTLEETKFRALLRSWVMWMPLTGMLLSSGFLCWALYDGQATVRAWELVTAGITTRTAIREIGAAGVRRSKGRFGKLKLGDTVALSDFLN